MIRDLCVCSAGDCVSTVLHLVPASEAEWNPNDRAAESCGIRPTCLSCTLNVVEVLP